jgi:hypothetical protein
MAQNNMAPLFLELAILNKKKTELSPDMVKGQTSVMRSVARCLGVAAAVTVMTEVHSESCLA